MNEKNVKIWVKCYLYQFILFIKTDNLIILINLYNNFTNSAFGYLHRKT